MSWSAEKATTMARLYSPDELREMARAGGVASQAKRCRSKRAISYAEVARRLHNRKATRAA